MPGANGAEAVRTAGRNGATARPLYEFDEGYVRRLAEGDRQVEEHFTCYFGDLLTIKLRARVRLQSMIEDVRQETFRRVLQVLRQGGLEHPERLGAFVNSVCNHVLSEAFRKEARYTPIGGADWVDQRINLNEPLIDEDRRRLVESVLGELSKRDRELLRMVFFEEKSQEEVGERLGVGETYARVLLHRAKSRFRDRLARGQWSAAERLVLWIRRAPVKRSAGAVQYSVRYSNGT